MIYFYFFMFIFIFFVEFVSYDFERYAALSLVLINFVVMLNLNKIYLFLSFNDSFFVLAFFCKTLFNFLMLFKMLLKFFNNILNKFLKTNCLICLYFIKYLFLFEK